MANEIQSQRQIGLTGGIATGKSTVSQYLAEKYSYPILDADIYAREAVAIASPILQTIFERYGNELKQADGSLARPALGRIIFNDPAEKRWLESQIHPFVRQRFAEDLARCPHQIIICVIPLLVEKKLFDLVTETWVVTCTPAQQLQRLQARNNLSKTEAIARIESQLPLSEKVKLADVVLNNSGDRMTLQGQVDRAVKGSC